MALDDNTTISQPDVRAHTQERVENLERELMRERASKDAAWFAHEQILKYSSSKPSSNEILDGQPYHNLEQHELSNLKLKVEIACLKQENNKLRLRLYQHHGSSRCICQPCLFGNLPPQQANLLDAANPDEARRRTNTGIYVDCEDQHTATAQLRNGSTALHSNQNNASIPTATKDLNLASRVDFGCPPSTVNSLPYIRHFQKTRKISEPSPNQRRYINYKDLDTSLNTSSKPALDYGEEGTKENGADPLSKKVGEGESQPQVTG